jgi:thioredoxin 1
MPTNKPIHVTDADFEETVLRAKGLSMVDFWAPWCGPCVQMAPAVEAFASANEEKVRVFKLDVDDNPKVAERYKIRSVPTIIFFRDGEPVDISAGAASQSALQNRLNALTNK